MGSNEKSTFTLNIYSFLRKKIAFLKTFFLILMFAHLKAEMLKLSAFAQLFKI